MKILRGQYAGEVFQLTQVANDWVAGNRGGRPVFTSPLNVEVDECEYRRLLTLRDPWITDGDQSCGRFWQLWDLTPDRIFTRAGPLTQPEPTPLAGARNCGPG